MSQPAETPSDANAEEQPETPGGILMASREVRWDAPLPPPELLQAYNETLPGAAERIMAMAEHQHNHRMRLENTQLEHERFTLETARTVANGESRRSSLGIAAGFILSLVGIGGGIYLVDGGHDWAGLTLAGLNLTSLAGVFVYGANSRRAARRRENSPEV